MTGNYLGPDIMFDQMRYSALQRSAEGCPPYELRDLGASYVSVTLLESLYYYVLRNAERCVVVRPNVLHEYLKGGLGLSGLQFPDVFPVKLHQQMWYPQSFRIVKGIMVVDDPVTSYMGEDDLEKFKALCGLKSLKIDLDECRKYRQGCRDFCKESDGARFVSVGIGKSPDRFQQKYKRRCISRRVVTSSEATQHCGKDKPLWSACKPVVLCAPRNIEASVSDPSIVLSGTVKRGAAGPTIGAVDIGISKVAYYFRVSLPGVRKDFCQFSCEIEPNGKVHLEGFTSGGNPIKKRSRVFHLKLQQVCPPGPFTLSFNLPGPVDPRLFALNFGSDGIFEGVILKEE